MSSLNKLNITDFKCKICNEILVFDTDDPKTYLTKSDSEDFFSMRLERYVVKHDTTEEEHFNVVIVDQNHKYRGHKDYYTKNKLFTKDIYHINSFQPLIKHSKFDLLLLLDFTTKEIVEIINSVQIMTINLCDKLAEFLSEYKNLYTNLPTEITYDYVNKKFFLVKKTDHIFVISSFYNPIYYKDYLKILQFLNSITLEVSDHLITNPALATMIRASDIINVETEFQYLDWIMTENILHIHFSLDDKMLDYIKDFFSRFEDTSCVHKPEFVKILEGKITILAYLQNNLRDLSCIKDTFDVLQRRMSINSN